MKGDFSRLDRAEARRYSGVRLQQGRVLMDSDWNALVDLLDYRLRAQARDLIGPTGAPAGEPGFRLRLALGFDGSSQYATLGESPVALFSGHPASSLELWLRPRADGGGGTVVSRFEQPRDEPRYRLAVGSDWHVAFEPAAPGVPRLLSARPIEPGRWCHVALCHDPGGSRLYLDGSLVASGAGFEIAGDAARYLVGLAQLAGDGPAGFAGAVRELRLWDRALAPDEVRRLAAGAAGAASPPIGEWWFDEAAGGQVADRSPHGNHAVLRSLTGAARPAVELGELSIGAGRYYVDGVLCDNPREVRFVDQPDLPGAGLPAADGEYLLYLDAWERLLTAAEQPALAEPALGGADTTVRTRVVSQVKWLPVVRPPGAGGQPDGNPDAGSSRAGSPCAGSDQALLREGSALLRARRHPVGEPGNRLYRVEIHAGGSRYGWPRPADSGAVLEIEAVDAESGRLTLDRSAGVSDLIAANGWVELFTAETDAEGRPGPLARVLEVDGRTVRLEPSAALSALADHQRRRLRPVASFKWSRENGSVALPVVGVEPGGLLRLGRTCRGEPPLQAGDWVELCDERSTLRGEPRPLTRIEELDAQTLTLTLRDAPPEDGWAGRRPVLRRWDQRAGSGALVGGALVATAAGWVKLEHGIEVQFEGDGGYRAGDYWTFTTRSGDGEIGWPREPGGEPAAQPPQGIDHHRAPLAVLRLGGAGPVLSDCRTAFAARTEDAVSRAGDSMHGPLAIRPRMAHQHALEVSGAAEIGELYLARLATPGVVESRNLAAASVTAAKIAPDVGTVPPGYAILGEHPEPPPGYAATGSAVQIPVADPQWTAHDRLANEEAADELHSAAVGRRIFTVTSSGKLWEYDPRSRRATARQSAPEARCGFAVAAANGKLYLVGGVDESGGYAAATLEYDPDADTWTERAPLPTPRRDLALAQAGGSLYAVGGLRRILGLEASSRKNEVYDPVADSWQRRRPLPAAVFGATATGGRAAIWLMGGERKWFLRLLGRSLSGRCHLYLPGLDRWSPMATLPAPRSHAAAADVGGRVYLVGGRSFLGWLGETASYTAQGDIWRRATPFTPAPGRPAAASIDGRLVIHLPSRAGEPIEVRELAVFHTYYVHRKLPAEDGPAA